MKTETLNAMEEMVTAILSKDNVEPLTRELGEDLLRTIALHRMEPKDAMAALFESLKTPIEQLAKGSPLGVVVCVDDARTSTFSMATAYSGNQPRSICLAISALIQILKDQFNFHPDDLKDLLVKSLD